MFQTLKYKVPTISPTRQHAQPCSCPKYQQDDKTIQHETSEPNILARTEALRKNMKKFKKKFYTEYLKHNRCLTEDILDFIFEFNGLDFVYFVVIKKLIYSKINHPFDWSSYFIFTNPIDSVLFMKKIKSECDVFLIQLNKTYSTSSFSDKKSREFLGYSSNTRKHKNIILFPHNFFILSDPGLGKHQTMVLQYHEHQKKISIRLVDSSLRCTDLSNRSVWKSRKQGTLHAQQDGTNHNRSVPISNIKKQRKGKSKSLSRSPGWIHNVKLKRIHNTEKTKFSNWIFV